MNISLEALAPRGNWVSMEAKLASSVLTLKMGDAGRKIRNKSDEEAGDHQRLLGGRQMLRFIYEEFSKDYFKSQHDAMKIRSNWKPMMKH